MSSHEIELPRGNHRFGRNACIKALLGVLDTEPTAGAEGDFLLLGLVLAADTEQENVRHQ
jgi:hypothetical protein